MPFSELTIKGAWIHTPARHFDNRGTFHEQLRRSEIRSDLGIAFNVEQANLSESRRGVLRGIHYSPAASNQRKFVSCVKGQIWDVIVDLRKDSKTFGEWQGIYLSEENGLSVMIPSGIGHGFLSIEDSSIVSYLNNFEYDPGLDYAIHPLDVNLGINFSEIMRVNGIEQLIMSERDLSAPAFINKTFV